MSNGDTVYGGAALSAPVPSWPIPPGGNVSAQMNQAQQLYNQAELIQAGSTSPSGIANLLGAGITIAMSGLKATPTTSAIKALVQGGIAIAGGACMGGPFGAAVGVISAAIGGIASLFQGYQGVVQSPSQGAEVLYKLLLQWEQANVGGTTSTPLGWSFWDYLSFKYPPNSTTRLSDLWQLRAEAFAELGTAILGVNGSGAVPVKSPWNPLGLTPVNVPSSEPGTPLYDAFIAGQLPMWVTKSPSNEAAALNRPGATMTPAYYRQLVQPLCTPVAFLWGQPSQIENCVLNQLFGAGEAPLSDLESLWRADTPPIVSGKRTQSASTVAANALKWRPDPMYFASDLYCFQLNNETVLYNLEMLSMVASWVGLAAAGAAPRAILSEMLSQVRAVSENNRGWVPWGCQQLVEDAIALCQSEHANSKSTLGGGSGSKVHRYSVAPKTSPRGASSVGTKARSRYVATTATGTGAVPSGGSTLPDSYAAASSGPGVGTAVVGVGAVGLAGFAAYKYL